MSATRALLKEARRAIDLSEPETAAKKCREILEIDENNYMALVLLGVALRDDEAAVDAFRRAISLESATALAYRGLAKFYESDRTEKHLGALLELYYEMTKLPETNAAEIRDNMRDVALRIGDADVAIAVLNKMRAESAPGAKNLTKRILTDFEGAPTERALPLFDFVIEEEEAESFEDAFVLKYLKCVLAANGHDAAIDKLEKFHRDSFALNEWACGIFAESFALKLDKNMQRQKFEAIAKSAIDERPDSIPVRRASAALRLLNGKYFEAHRTIVDILRSVKSDDHVSVLGALCCVELGRYAEAENICRQYTDDPKGALCVSAKRILSRAKCSQDDPADRREGIEIAKSLDAVFIKEDEQIALFRAHLHLKEFSEAERRLKNLPDSSSAHLKASLARATGRSDEASEILRSNRENHHCELSLAIRTLENKDYANAFHPLLRCAKNDPDNYVIYLHLGDFYTFHERDYEKAKKCYLKSFELNPECSKAGKSLSRTYANLKEWSSNEIFLKSLTNDQVVAANNKLFWPWLYLGLHYLSIEQWDIAVVNLRTYIRLNSSDVDAWETLADAYYHRGSYTSAMKCYKKALEYDSSRKYCHVQIGTIQCLLGFFGDALTTYANISDDSFLPGINGLAEVKICIANELYSKDLYGSCRDVAQEAIDLVSPSVPMYKNFVCLWKVIYNALQIIVKLPPKYCRVNFNSDLFFPDANDGVVLEYESDKIFNLALFCLDKMMSLSEGSTSYLYYEIASTYYAYYEVTRDPSLAEKSYAAIEKCFDGERDKWQVWNLLGIICASEPITKYDLAQHGFIKALELDPINATVWSNLGVFYYIIGNYILANQAFSKAQESNPTLIHSWIGQAIIAEKVGHHEAMDFFRHAAQLGFHKESSLGYSFCVAKNLIKEIDDIYSIKNMHALPAANDLSMKHNEYEFKTPCSWNIYGVLSERMGYFKRAIVAYANALEGVDDKYRDVVLLNLARAYGQDCDYVRAIETIRSISNMTVEAAQTLALFYYKNEQFEESYEAYQEILEWKGNDKEVRNNVLIAMADICYKLDQQEAAEILLLQCFNNKCLGGDDDENVDVDECFKNMPVEALISYCAISLLEYDTESSEIALSNLPHLSNNAISHNANVLELYYLLICKDYTATARELCNKIHVKPTDERLWKIMTKISHQDVQLANVSSKKCLTFADIENRGRFLQLACLSELVLGNFKESKRYAQKLVRMRPNEAENWTLLISTVLSEGDSINLEWLMNLLDCVLHTFDLSNDLQLWLINLYKFIQ